jgi:hypothetical protein
MDEEEDAVMRVPGAKVSAAKLLRQRRFKFGDAPAFRDFDFDCNTRIRCLGPQADVRFFFAGNVRFPLDRISLPLLEAKPVRDPVLDRGFVRPSLEGCAL